MSRSYTDRFTGAILGLACGDAVGDPVEYNSKEGDEKQFGRLTSVVSG